MKNIEFIPVTDKIFHPPVPASELIPDWYKKAQSYRDGKKAIEAATIKKCLPLFDALTAGYILFTQTDVYITNNEHGGKNWQYRGGADYIPFSNHIADQLQNHPNTQKELDGAGKIEQPFVIKTPRGYSTLFIQPVHRETKYFRIHEGIVDTDKYFIPVNFPLYFVDPEFEGLIPAGTPIAQVIPIKREAWNHKISEPQKERVFFEMAKLKSVFWNGYKRFFWERKTYR